MQRIHVSAKATSLTIAGLVLGVMVVAAAVASAAFG